MMRHSRGSFAIDFMYQRSLVIVFVIGLAINFGCRDAFKRPKVSSSQSFAKIYGTNYPLEIERVALEDNVGGYVGMARVRFYNGMDSAFTNGFTNAFNPKSIESPEALEFWQAYALSIAVNSKFPNAQAIDWKGIQTWLVDQKNGLRILAFDADTNRVWVLGMGR